ncbi:MAG: hypothetical protein KKG47_12390 [Proteobacteria bacterium]|nr:hypothetical protein [Pseudomonadota bacterium]MBU1737741.1 hypothetical protein [Pseudomonadota bacterium]
MNRGLLVGRMFTLLFLLGGGVVSAAGGGQEFSWQHPEAKEGGYPASLEYRGYYHNYPHTLPPDYVFRTGRVFGPAPAVFNWRDPLAFFRGEGAGARGSRGRERKEGGSLEGGLPVQVAELVARLLANSREDFTDEYVLAVSTFVNLNDLYVTSSLGRFLAEQLVAELQSRGAEVVEIRKTPAIMIRQREGEYGLSRDMDELSFVQGAQGVVTGTYAVSGDRIFLNARVLRNSDNLILASASLALEIDREIRYMLADEKSSGRRVLKTTAAVPVRSFAEVTGHYQPVEE